MLIDAILDRRDGQEYSPKALYNYLNGWAGGLYDDVCRALDEGESVVIKREKISLNVDNPQADDILMSYARKVLPIAWQWDDYMQLVCHPDNAEEGVYFLCNFS